ncbi:short-chain dehydrogenase TIC 32 B, chloroplastic-like [Zingiber officinale]|uniref:short-chain dehydrogenase TIC 32 B, chloroplastic-like n=1 Tax=Zingiber officinale TaxID=94328 RepID=UPI001C4D9B68|nr:short-chain dehydrogenase TIC 32 B, chloroplastic-like [Zingiber officinale]
MRRHSAGDSFLFATSPLARLGHAASHRRSSLLPHHRPAALSSLHCHWSDLHSPPFFLIPLATAASTDDDSEHPGHLYAMHHPKLRSMTPSVAFNFFRRLPSKVDMLLRSAIYISHSHVIIGARNTEVASEVKHSILQSTPSARINIIQIELSSLMSIRAFAEKFLAMDLPLNILINNVGVMYCPFQLLEDGIEMQFATNHVGHFLLTKLLLDKMKSTAERTGIESRIVNHHPSSHDNI